MPKTFALTLDLKDDAKLIAAYEEHHRQVPQAITKHIRDAGVLSMEIYRWSNRLFLTMVTDDNFSVEKMKELDEANTDVQAWEKFMWTFQQPLPGTKAGDKWQRMDQVFAL